LPQALLFSTDPVEMAVKLGQLYQILFCHDFGFDVKISLTVEIISALIGHNNVFLSSKFTTIGNSPELLPFSSKTYPIATWQN
jgi:hypothetical protein